MALSLSALQARAVVLDVEGTTTPVEFVYEVLFPFAREHAAGYLQQESRSAPCREALEQLREERAKDFASGELPSGSAGAGELPAFGTAQVLEYVQWLMDRDRKSPGLKALQGLIWQEGFRTGALRGGVYPDVPRAFDRWSAAGYDLYIYSSGSVLAQQLLFGSTDAGDLTTRLKGHFDTGVGPKTSAASYSAIAGRIHVEPAMVLFVSDVVAELDAARTAGLRTVLCVRGGASSVDPATHPVVHSFDEIAA